jgi:hypothetical protein
VESGTILLSESSGWMDILDVLASGMTTSGGLSHGLLQLLELYERHEPVSHLVALPIAVVGMLDVSPDGDDTVQSWHL